MLKEFIDYLEKQLGSIYVLGAQGQEVISNDWIKYREHYVKSNYERAIKLWDKKKAEGFTNIKAYDCSGLGMKFLLDNKLFPSDLNARGMYSKCAKIKKEDVKRGDWVFRYDLRIHHIGYVVDDLNVIESRGRDYGVVKRPLSEGNWNRYGRPEIFKNEIHPSSGGSGFVLKRILKRTIPMMRGEDVKQLQTRLFNKGYPISIDGIFGNETLKAVKEYQKKQGLKVDGIVGEKTALALGR